MIKDVIQSAKDKRLLLKDVGLNVCYCDESGTGQEPIATMVGIIVDSSRMHLTTQHWNELLESLASITGRKIAELHAADFYAGNGVWRAIDGPMRAKVIDGVCDWLIQRKHSIVYSSVLKEAFGKAKDNLPPEISSIWRFLGFHIILAIQKYSQSSKVPKGNTFMFFDDKEQEKEQFIEIIKNPPEWSGEYYAKSEKGVALDQIVDRCPAFSRSQDRPLLQVADFLAFFLRRYAEITEGLCTCKYEGEEIRLNEWIRKFKSRTIGSNYIYLKYGRKPAHEHFHKYASPSLRDLMSN